MLSRAFFVILLAYASHAKPNYWYLDYHHRYETGMMKPERNMGSMHSNEMMPTNENTISSNGGGMMAEKEPMMPMNGGMMHSNGDMVMPSKEDMMAENEGVMSSNGEMMPSNGGMAHTNGGMNGQDKMMESMPSKPEEEGNRYAYFYLVPTSYGMKHKGSQNGGSPALMMYGPRPEVGMNSETNQNGEGGENGQMVMNGEEQKNGHEMNGKMEEEMTGNSVMDKMEGQMANGESEVPAMNGEMTHENSANGMMDNGYPDPYAYFYEHLRRYHPKPPPTCPRFGKYLPDPENKCRFLWCVGVSDAGYDPISFSCPEGTAVPKDYSDEGEDSPCQLFDETC